MKGEEQGMFDSIIHDMQKIGCDWRAILIIAAVAVIAVFLIWLIFRGLRLWYWRVNKRVETLESIDGKLDEIRNEIRDRKFLIAAPIEIPEISAFKDKASKDDKPTAENVQGIAESSMDTKTDVKIAEKDEVDCLSDAGELKDGIYSIGKSGKVYTQEEIELLIRD